MVTLATFLVLDSHMWLVDTILENIDTGRFPHCRNVHWTVHLEDFCVLFTSLQSLARACPPSFLLYSPSPFCPHSFWVFDSHLTQVLCHEKVCVRAFLLGVRCHHFQMSQYIDYLLVTPFDLGRKGIPFSIVLISGETGSESTSNLYQVAIDTGHLVISGIGFFSWFVPVKMYYSCVVLILKVDTFIICYVSLTGCHCGKEVHWHGSRGTQLRVSCLFCELPAFVTWSKLFSSWGLNFLIWKIRGGSIYKTMLRFLPVLIVNIYFGLLFTHMALDYLFPKWFKDL